MNRRHVFILVVGVLPLFLASIISIRILDLFNRNNSCTGLDYLFHAKRFPNYIRPTWADSPRTVVIAAAYGYDLQTYKVFLLSLRCVAGYKGDVVLFVEDPDNQTTQVARLCNAMNVRRTRINTKRDESGTDSDVNAGPIPIPTTETITHNDNESSHTNSAKWSPSHVGIDIASGFNSTYLGVKGDRYVGYASVCAQYQWCLATDFRDVFFQSDPFDDAFFMASHTHTKHTYSNLTQQQLQPHSQHDTIHPNMSLPSAFESQPASASVDIIFFEEQSIISEEPINTLWISSCWPEVLSTIQHNPVICSGTVYATPEGMVHLRDIMLKEMTRSSTKVGCVTGDQGHVNYLLYTGKMAPLNIQVQKFGTGFVSTIGTLTMKQLASSMNHEGFVVNENRRKAPVVHQFDRHPELVKAIQTRISRIDKSFFGAQIKNDSVA